MEKGMLIDLLLVEILGISGGEKGVIGGKDDPLPDPEIPDSDNDREFFSEEDESE